MVQRTLVAVMQSMGTRNASSTFGTPTCVAPRALPPEHERDLGPRGLRGRLAPQRAPEGARR
jgi:hypothetical protein